MKQKQGISPWLAAARETFSSTDLPSLFEKETDGFTFSVHNTGDALWIMTSCPGGNRLALRTAFAPNGKLTLQEMEEGEVSVVFSLRNTIADYTVTLSFPAPGQPLFRCTTLLTPRVPLLMPFWPRDLLVLGKEGSTALPAGEIHVHQEGPRSGLIYAGMKKPAPVSFLYMQHLTALSDYCEQTGTTVSATVDGQWPELGFALPPAKEKPLEAGKEYVISDAFLLLATEFPADEFHMARQFLELLADIYIHFPKPSASYHHWPDILENTLHDLANSAGCWTQVQGHPYLNAYVCDYKTPPEIMVQLAVLLPLMEYAAWSRRDIPIIKDIKGGLPAFYDKRINCIARWLPAAEDRLSAEEEHKKPRTMDAWYLHHPLLNLSRMALSGDKDAEKLFLDSLEYPIKVARHFKYQWPVFYDMDTLDVIKEETAPGKGGEKDVPGLYAHVMLQAWKLTEQKRYLDEAKKAAKALQGTGFTLFYQANNTAFSAGAMLTLYKITEDKLYLDLAYLCLANVFKNMWLWDCDYGTGKHFPSFFALFPLNNAPYTAVYEEQEGFAAFHDFLEQVGDMDILPAVSLLLPEFIRYMLFRAAYYYPPMLPEDMLADKPNTGEIAAKLWIPLEDLYDGRTAAGTVGQEVYGAGLAFGVIPRHYHKLPEGPFMIFVDYPVTKFSINKKNSSMQFFVIGDERMHCHLLLLPLDDNAVPAITLMEELQDGPQEISGKRNAAGYTEYMVRGNRQVMISWKNARNGAVQKTTRKKAKITSDH